MNKFWMIRAGIGGSLVDEFLEKGIVSMGWDGVGDLSKLQNREAIKATLRNQYPDYKKGKVSITAGQLYRFGIEIKPGDKIVTYDPSKRIYHIGTINQEYKFIDNTDGYKHILGVKWELEKSRDSLSTGAKYYLGAIMTLFEISNDVEMELLDKAPMPIDSEETDEETDTIIEDTIEKAHEFIKDKILKLDWEEMQELVAGILRGMGYRTRVSSRGPDRGRDIIASPDGLGLEDPRIIVEVKHRNETIGSPALRSFTGGLRANDKGLYVSTGGFTKEAKYEAERSNIPVTLIDTDELVLLINQYYENFDSETKTLIPLKKIYWPV